MQLEEANEGIMNKKKNEVIVEQISQQHEILSQDVNEELDEQNEFVECDDDYIEEDDDCNLSEFLNFAQF